MAGRDQAPGLERQLPYLARLTGTTTTISATTTLMLLFTVYSSSIPYIYVLLYAICIQIGNFVSNISEEGIDLIEQLTTLNPARRLSARQALAHPYMSDMMMDN